MGGKGVRKDDVVKPKLKRRKRPDAMTWLLSREGSRVYPTVASLSLSLFCISTPSLHTHTVHGHGFQAINTLAFIYAYLHASGSPWASSGNLTSSAFCHPVPARLVNIASVSGSRCLGPLISTLAPCLSGVIAGYYNRELCVSEPCQTRLIRLRNFAQLVHG